MFLTKPQFSAVVVLALGVVGTGAGLRTREAFAQGAGEKGPKTVDLTDANYTKLRDYVHPTADELAWRKIPWVPSVWDGIVEGQKSDRPILMWILNGHPLGCT
jgi:hypothetical protein